jgi:hypothetical protein
MLEGLSTSLKQHSTCLRTRHAILLIALIIFSVQFLFPWNGDSWLRFYRSLSTCLLIVAAISAFRAEERLFNPVTQEPDETEQLRNVRWTRDFVLSFIIGGGIVLLIYSLQFLLPKESGSREVLALVGAGGLLSMASMMSGALLGFIFGIPRFLREKQTNQAQAKSMPPSGTQTVPGQTVPAASGASANAAGQNESSQFQSNTNLEEISDWLTKIIVGLGLTKLAKIPDYVKRLTWFVSHSIGEGHHEFNENVAFSLMTAFSICGFFMGYLMTRLFLQRAFDVTADPSAGFRAAVHSAGQGDLSMDAVPSAAVLGSGIQSALGVQSASQGLGDAVIRSQITKLAKVYEALRLSMSSGDERTQFMEKIAAQMKSLALAAQPFLDELKKSQSSGERLAAVTALEIAPDEGSLDWLVERIDAERPFIGYHAALALLSAVRAFTPPSATAPDSVTQTASSVPNQPHQHVCDAIQKSMKLLEDKKLRETDRYEVLTAAKKEGMCP